MPQSLSNVMLHTVFSTKNRQRFLQDADLRGELHHYMGGVAKTLECQPLTIGGTSDHVHLLTYFSRTITIADMLKELKRRTSSWLVDEKEINDFEWQNGYGTFSVSESQVSVIKDYIRNQGQHHSRMSFQDEFRALLQKHGIEFDERYVWD